MAKKKADAAGKGGKSEADIKVVGALRESAADVLAALDAAKNPKIAIPLRSLSNVFFDEKEGMIRMGNKQQLRAFFNVGQAKKFLQTFLIASAIKENLIDTGKTTSIRDLFYMTKHTIANTNENTFDEQEESDPIIEDIEVMIDVLREELHLFASSRGALVGNITIVDGGDEIDCRKLGTGGWAIPSIVEKDIIQFKKCDADFVLIVEKDAVFRRLNEDKFWKKHNCILLHGQGVPPRGVRRLLWRFANELKLPVYVLCDADVWGAYIYSVIKQGSINLAYESMRTAVPNAKFLGLSVFDVDRYKLPATATIKLNQEDIRRAHEILKYPWFKKKGWQEEIREMLRRGIKLELEALSKKGISFISETYLPEKIKNKQWLE